MFTHIRSKVYKVALKFAKPMAIANSYEVLSVDSNAIKIEGLIINGKLALSQLGKSQEISALFVTLGKELDDEISFLHDKGKEWENVFQLKKKRKKFLLSLLHLT